MPISITRLRELIELAGSDGVDSIDIVEDGTRVRITRNGTTTAVKTKVVEATKARASAGDPDVFHAPMFGVLHLTPAPGAKPYVVVGDHVRKGQQLGLIEAMKLFSPIHSDRDGLVEQLLAEPGQEVANGQPLFRIKAV